MIRIRSTVAASLLALGMIASGAVQAADAKADAKPADARPAAAPLAAQTGMVAWYGRKFAGRRTASGERFDPAKLTMAHPTLPFGTRVKVTHLGNKRSVIVRVNDRGPRTPGRIADLSHAAAKALGMLKKGVAEVRLDPQP